MMYCSCGFGSDCGWICANGHNTSQCPPLTSVKPKLLPHCEYCGSIAPYGDERNLWIGAHQHRWKRLTQRVMKDLRQHWPFKNAKEKS